MARVEQVVFDRLDHADVDEGFTQQQGAAVAGGPLAT